MRSLNTVVQCGMRSLGRAKFANCREEFAKYSGALWHAFPKYSGALWHAFPKYSGALWHAFAREGEVR